eukprot:s36_g26.t1
MATIDEKSRLETFDGSNPGMYRLWRRRAQLMIAGLPTTVPKEKYGPRLMEYIKGEAEALLETIPVSELIKADGDKAIWLVLDEKYGPQPRDLLQHALRNYLYDLQVKPGETYLQFMARHDAAIRLLKEQSIELPPPVMGFLLIKKLKLDQSQESMVLTHTKGGMDFKDVVAAVRGIFPEGMGTVRSKEVFQADEDGQSSGYKEVTMVDEENDLAEVAQLIADESQELDGDEEEALETFETYLDVRKRLRDQKTSRGFQNLRGGPDQGQWKLAGTVKGKLELLKARTTCHVCRQKGHWKRECPHRTGGGRGESSSRAGAASGSSSKGASEVNVVERHGREVLLADEVWEMFKTGGASITTSGSPTPEREAFVTEVFSNDPGETNHPEVTVDDPILSECAVPDTACRRTLVGAYTLQGLERHLRRQGMSVSRRAEISEFRFGNSGTLTSHEAVIIPAKLGSRKFLIKAAVLPSSSTPLLLSKEVLRQLDCVLDLSKDRLKVFGDWYDLESTGRGHYAIRCFDFSDECLIGDVRCDGVAGKKEYRIDELECDSRSEIRLKTRFAPCSVAQAATEEDRQAWKSSTKALDVMDDLSDDGEDNPISGLTILKEGKYKSGKNALELKAIYVTDKPYCEWVRHHIDKTSGKDMQRLKIYILCRDQAKKNRLSGGQSLEEKGNVIRASQAKAKPGPRGVKNARAPSEASMEWSYVGNQGHEIVIMEMMNGLPVRQVNPLQPDHDVEEHGLMMEMQAILSATLGNPGM